MKNGDIELNGFLMGRDHPVFATAIAPGDVVVRDQDNENPYASERIFGIDYRKPPVWKVEFSVGEADGAQPDSGVLDALDSLAAAWSVDFEDPEVVIPLRYMIGGRVRRVWGRPRNFRFEASMNIADGNIIAGADFALKDTLFYDDAQQLMELRLRSPSTGYATLPGVWPVTSYTTSDRQGLLTSTGTAKVLLEEITFHGPVIDPKLELAGGWTLGLDRTIAYDGWITVNPRLGTIRDQSGASLPGIISRTVYLPDLKIAPGPNSFTYSGKDETSFSKVVIKWREANNGL